MTEVTVNTETKKWYKSRTVWVGVLETLSGVALALADYVATGGALTLFGVAKIVLRTITNTKVEL